MFGPWFSEERGCQMNITAFRKGDPKVASSDLDIRGVPSTCPLNYTFLKGGFRPL